MSESLFSVVPVGRVDDAEVRAALARASKPAREPFELRERLPVPHGSEDPERGQHRAAALLELLRREVVKLRPGTLVGSDDPAAKPSPRPAGFIFVTDVDLYTARSEGVLAALSRGRQSGVVSLRRLREAHYRRKADPDRQRARLTKEILRVWARLRGAPECGDPHCLLAASPNLPAVDTKDERFCRACEQRLFEGRLRI